MKDNLGDRMKRQYEDRTRFFLPRRTYTIIRVDGKAFHSYTKYLEAPFDRDFVTWMNCTTTSLCELLQGAQFGFVQSDEISILLTDFAEITTEAYFDNNVQKLASVSASIATCRFNALATKKTALFDARTFTIPDPTEVENYFIWRQKDAIKNSIQSLAQHHFSHQELQGLSQAGQIDLLLKDKIDWKDLDPGIRNGRLITRKEQGWVTNNSPVFTEEKEFLSKLVPRYT